MKNFKLALLSSAILVTLFAPNVHAANHSKKQTMNTSRATPRALEQCKNQTPSRQKTTGRNHPNQTLNFIIL